MRAAYERRAMLETGGEPIDRRDFVRTSVGARLASRALAADYLPALWDVDRSVANLENAYRGAMPREVEAEYLAETRFLNRRNALLARDGIAGRERTAAEGDDRAEDCPMPGDHERSPATEPAGASAGRAAATTDDAERGALAASP